ncbi:MAG: dephospho-CoA kinase [Aquificaceae bacterium]|nr:dephospho-CoA kinase [Aquificaceae bacterium]MDW8237458.1 dephospho-CoA kinase [Aquificaceae bacterium]
MLKLGLTGNIASGKSTVGKLFQRLGAYYFDADEIIKSLYRKDQELYAKVLKHFGSTILDERGEIDRRILANLVFSDIAKLKTLEELTHAALYEYLSAQFLKIPKNAIAIVEATLLIEKGTYRHYDAIILVYSKFEDCLKRGIMRGMTPEDFFRRWRHQLSPDIKTRFAHFIIKNNSSERELLRRAEEVFNTFKLWNMIK